MGCIIKRILTFKEPVSFGPLVITDEVGRDITTTCNYSWSMDSVCWTDWTDYNTYLNIGKNIESDFYLRVLLFGGLGEVIINNISTTCYTICLYNENMFLQDLCSDAVFDPYANLDCALQLQQQLSDSVICMLGIPCYYFRVTPNKDTADYTFKEYVLHNVESVKFIKLMIQDGTMPSSKPQMTDFDFDWDSDWEVEISKNYFAKAFGDTAFPKHNDFIYIPMMKRMWNVNSAYDEKNEGLLWHSTTWKLALVKYNDNTNIDQGDFEDIIDSLLVNTFDNTFEVPENEEQERETGVTQVESPKYAANNTSRIFMTDYLRKYVDDAELKNVLTEQVNHGSAVVARNYYHFVNDSSAVIYQNKWCGDSGTVAMLMSFQNHTSTKHLVQAGDVTIDINDGGALSFNGMQTELDYQKYLVIASWDKQTFTSNINVYKQIGPDPNQTPAYMIRPEMYKFDFANPVYSKTSAYNNDFDITRPVDVVLSPHPCDVFYFKLFDTLMDHQSIIKEACKYTTTNEHCVINDLARPFEEAYGFSTK